MIEKSGESCSLLENQVGATAAVCSLQAGCSSASRVFCTVYRKNGS